MDGLERGGLFKKRNFSAADELQPPQKNISFPGAINTATSWWEG